MPSSWVNIMEYTKQILATLREGDFAHPGEIEAKAIELSLSPIAKNSGARLLMIGGIVVYASLNHT
ncbi:TPA: hypothetical protein ACT9MP_002644 [Legionella pneumophila]